MTAISVVFEDAWLTDPTDPTVSVHASYPDRGHKAAVDSEVRTYAGGRRRVITSARKSRTHPITLQLVSGDDLAQLEAWQGRVLLLRDGEGKRVWGSFSEVDVEDFWDADGPQSNVTLVLTEVDYDESVT